MSLPEQSTVPVPNYSFTLKYDLEIRGENASMFHLLLELIDQYYNRTEEVVTRYLFKIGFYDFQQALRGGESDIYHLMDETVRPLPEDDEELLIDTRLFVEFSGKAGRDYCRLSDRFKLMGATDPEIAELFIQRGIMRLSDLLVVDDEDGGGITRFISETCGLSLFEPRLICRDKRVRHLTSPILN